MFIVACIGSYIPRLLQQFVETMVLKMVKPFRHKIVGLFLKKESKSQQQTMTCFTSRFASILSKMSENNGNLQQTCNLDLLLFE